MIRTKLEISRDIEESIRFYDNLPRKDKETEGIIVGLKISLDYLWKNND